MNMGIKKSEIATVSIIMVIALVMVCVFSTPYTFAASNATIGHWGAASSVRTDIYVGATGAGSHKTNYTFNASAKSTISTSKKISDHKVALTLKKNGLTGTLSLTGGGSVSSSSSSVASLTSSKSTSPVREAKTTNVTVHRTIVGSLIKYLVSIGQILTYFTISGTATSSAEIGGIAYSNHSYVTSYY